MGTMSIWHWLIVLIVVLLLFGSGKISTLMGDFAKGIKVFKKNMATDDAVEPADEQKKPLAGIGETVDGSVSFNEEKTKTRANSKSDSK